MNKAGLIELVAGSALPSALKVYLRGVLVGLARGLYERKHRPPATHICLLAGGGAAVFPGWKAEPWDFGRGL